MRGWRGELLHINVMAVAFGTPADFCLRVGCSRSLGSFSRGARLGSSWLEYMLEILHEANDDMERLATTDTTHHQIAIAKAKGKHCRGAGGRGTSDFLPSGGVWVVRHRPCCLLWKAMTCERALGLRLFLYHLRASECVLDARCGRAGVYLVGFC